MTTAEIMNRGRWNTLAPELKTGVTFLELLAAEKTTPLERADFCAYVAQRLSPKEQRHLLLSIAGKIDGMPMPSAIFTKTVKDFVDGAEAVPSPDIYSSIYRLMVDTAEANPKCAEVVVLSLFHFLNRRKNNASD